MSAKARVAKLNKKDTRKKNINKQNKKKQFKQGQQAKTRTSPQQYLKEVRLELNKVAWPSRHEVITFTIIVLAMVVVFGLYTGALDFIFQQLLKLSTGLRG